jgi:hypothetical protein
MAARPNQDSRRKFMKDINQRKQKILSVRLTEPEVRELNQLMKAKQMSASDLLREALLSFSRQSPRPGGNAAVTARAA